MKVQMNDLKGMSLQEGDPNGLLNFVTTRDLPSLINDREPVFGSCHSECSPTSVTSYLAGLNSFKRDPEETR